MLSATTPVELPAAAFLFVDIVSFTAYTEAHGDAAAAGERALRRRAIALETIGERVLRNVTLPVLIHGAIMSERSARSGSATVRRSASRRPRAPLSAVGRSSIGGAGIAHA